MENYKSRFTGIQIDTAIEKALNASGVYEILKFNTEQNPDTFRFETEIPDAYKNLQQSIIQEENKIPSVGGGNALQIAKNYNEYFPEQDLIYYYDKYEVYQSYSVVATFYIKTKEPEKPSKYKLYINNGYSYKQGLYIYGRNYGEPTMRLVCPLISESDLNSIKNAINQSTLNTAITNLRNELTTKINDVKTSEFNILIYCMSEFNVTQYVLTMSSDYLNDYFENGKLLTLDEALMEFGNLVSCFITVDYTNEDNIKYLPEGYKIKFQNENNEWVTYQAKQNIEIDKISGSQDSWEQVGTNFIVG